MAYSTLQINDGNVYRTARDTGIPRPTLQSWVKEWKEVGVPEEIRELASQDAHEFVEHAESVRNQALAKLETLIPHAQPKDMKSLVIAIGTLDDKIRLAKGLATQRREHTLAPPDPEKFKESLETMVKMALQSADDNVIEGEIIQRELPQGENT